MPIKPLKTTLESILIEQTITFIHEPSETLKIALRGFKLHVYLGALKSLLIPTVLSHFPCFIKQRQNPRKMA
jgi:hypothetical protein